jgi:hypothetical protein
MTIEVKAKPNQDQADGFLTLFNTLDNPVTAGFTLQASSSERMKLAEMADQSTPPEATRVKLTFTGLKSIRNKGEAQLVRRLLRGEARKTRRAPATRGGLFRAGR